MVGQVKYCDNISEPEIKTNVHGGQIILLPKPELPKIKVGKVYIIGNNKKSKAVNVGTESNVILDFYFPKNKIIELLEEDNKI